ncbi:amino acid permease-domain-containing protein [Suillus spraguei]|nr:amino acid permease-domain-containing protein [Suillus spraguei]
MTNIDNVPDSEVLAQSEDAQDEGNTVPALSNPLGYKVTLLSSVTLNIGRMLGAGIYSVPGVILNSVGSIGLLFTFWLLSPLFALGGILIYSEYASMFPKRSGAEVVYLEQAYPHPRFLVPVMFAVTSVLLSATNSIIFAQYALTIFDIPITPTTQTIVAVTACAVAMGLVALSTKWSLRAVNFLTGLKLGLHGRPRTWWFHSHPRSICQFSVPFSGSTTNPNSLATALVKTNYAFAGWNNAFNVIGEVHTRDPVRTVRKASLLSLLLMTSLFFFVNVAYVAAVPKDEISNSGQLIAALFFQHVFGEGFAAKTLPAMVSLSCFGNIIAVTIGQTRVLREIARQGLLPYPGFFASTKPFDTPLAPVCLKCFLTVLVILVLPARDAFNFLVPPEPGHSDVSFWYAAYCVVGLGALALCGVYYWLWIVALPRLGGYTIVEEVEQLKDGALATRLTRKYHSSVEGSDNGEQQPLIAST